MPKFYYRKKKISDDELYNLISIAIGPCTFIARNVDDEREIEIYVESINATQKTALDALLKEHREMEELKK